jgi:DNA-directed RNA polymerase subunit RPC12/RpoP
MRNKKKSKSDSHICGVCSKSFNYLKALDKHLTAHLSPKNRIVYPYKCDECNKIFTKVQNMNTHRALVHDLF